MAFDPAVNDDNTKVGSQNGDNQNTIVVIDAGETL